MRLNINAITQSETISYNFHKKSRTATHTFAICIQQSSLGFIPRLPMLLFKYFTFSYTSQERECGPLTLSQIPYYILILDLRSFVFF